MSETQTSYLVSWEADVRRPEQRKFDAFEEARDFYDDLAQDPHTTKVSLRETTEIGGRDIRFFEHERKEPFASRKCAARLSH